jgi:hypothetical protein
VDSLLFSTRAWRQKGIDSVASLVGSGLTGTGISGYMPKWTGAKALDTSQIRQVGGNIGISMSPVNRLDVSGVIGVNTSGQTRTISSFYGSGADGFNIWIGGGGASSGTGGGASTNGSYNTATGHESMRAATTGSYNAAFGRRALENMTTGAQNNAFGVNALLSITTASNNVGVGTNSLLNTTMSNNTAIGTNSGTVTNANSALTDVSNGVFVGNDTRALNSTSTNEIVIGYQGRGNGSNTTTIGNISTTATY